MTLETPLLEQNGSYSASEMRKLVRAALPNIGVIEGADLLVTQRAAGANMSVDVAAGSVVVESSTSSRGRYLCRSTSTENLAISAAPGAGTSRIDLVIARVYDTEYGEASDSFTLEVVTGTAGATPSAPAMPGSSIELARVTVTSASASVTNSIISDTRQHARQVTYSDRLPFYGSNGQVVVTSSGIVYTRSAAGWKAQAHPDQFAVSEATISATTLSTTNVAIKTVTIPQPPGAVNVLGQVNGYMDITGTNAVFEVRVDVSFNGGSTWVTGVANRGYAPNALAPATISASAARSGTPTGTVQVRVVARRTAGTGDYAGQLSVMVTPG